MNLHLPRSSALAVALFVVAGIAVGLFLTARFGGPAIRLHDPPELRAVVRDTQGLAVRSDVLVRGVRVGRVASIGRPNGAGAATVTLALDAQPLTVRRTATVRVGLKTLLGEAYVDLDPGHGAPVRSGATLPRRQVLPSVQVDEALRVLDAHGRDDLRSLLADAGRGARAPQTSERLSQTLVALRSTVGQVRALGATLHGQSGQLAAVVTDGRAVMDELASRSSAIRTVVHAGRVTLAATAAGDRSLRAGLAELPGLLGAARSALARARPLVGDARPVLSDLRAAAPPLTAALRAAPPLVRDARAVLAGARPLARATLPALALARPLLAALRPAAHRLAPALANLVPTIRYLSDRRRTIAAWFSNTADLGLNGDAKGSWARFFVFFDPATAIGSASGSPETNPYTGPGDAADNQPHRPGSYPRLRPWSPPNP